MLHTTLASPSPHKSNGWLKGGVFGRSELDLHLESTSLLKELYGIALRRRALHLNGDDFSRIN